MASSKIGGSGSATGAKGTQRGTQRMLRGQKARQLRSRRRLGSFRKKA